MLKFAVFLANSDEKTIFDGLTHIVHIKFLLSFIKGSYNLTHIILNIMIFFSICVAFSNLSSKFQSKDNMV